MVFGRRWPRGHDVRGVCRLDVVPAMATRRAPQAKHRTNCSTASCRSTTSSNAIIFPSTRLLHSRWLSRGEIDLSNSPIIRAVFKGRELILRATPDAQPRPRGLLAQVQSLGWVVLAEIADHEVVVGAVTKPWEANVTFRSIPATDFAAFNEPDYVKIAWTLRADATGPSSSIFRTETRAVATDAAARSRFRPYWAFLSPGIFLIRQMMLRPVKTQAERQAYFDMGPSDPDEFS